VGPRAGLEGCGKSLAHRFVLGTMQDVRTKSLYPLSYPGPKGCVAFVYKGKNPHELDRD